MGEILFLTLFFLTYMVYISCKVQKKVICVLEFGQMG